MASGRLVTDMNYRHWDHYVESIAHPFVAQVSAQGIDAGDVYKRQEYDAPLLDVVHEKENLQPLRPLCKTSTVL